MAAGAVVQRVFQLVAEAEDFLGVVQRHAAGVSQRQAAAAALEQAYAQLAFQGGDLPGKGLRREAGVRGSAYDAARTGDRPEMMELAEVQHAHRRRRAGPDTVRKNLRKIQLNSDFTG